MALPVSGSLSIKGAAGAGRSICEEVGISSGSLLTLGTTGAGFSTPIGMTSCFYGYVSKTPIDWTQYYSLGTQGVSNCVSRYFCIDTKPAAGQTYSITIRADQCTIGQASGSYSLICVTCNGLSKMYCCISVNQCATPQVIFTVDSNDCVRSCNRAYAANTSCLGATGVRSMSCIFSVTGTYHCKGLLCTLGFACTG